MLFTLRRLSKALIVFALGVFCYDAIYEWVNKAMFRQRSLQAWWEQFDADSYKFFFTYAEKAMTTEYAEIVLQKWPASWTLFVVGATLYVVYWVLFKLVGGHGPKTFRYKSSD